MTPLRAAAIVVALLAVIATGSAQPPSIAGRVAYIGNDHNVYVIDGSLEPQALTADADDVRRYQFPTWSTDERLAFFCCDSSYTQNFSLEMFVATPDLTAAKRLYAAENEAYTYAAWSPANCAAGPSCRDMAVLVSQPGQPFKVELIRQNGTATTARTAATGAPFYLSWNVDGQRMLWHRNNRQVSVFDAATDTAQDDMRVTPGGMQAPAFSPVDDRAAVVLLEAGGISSALVVLDGDVQTALVTAIPADVRGFPNITSFNWSPDGRYIGYRAINRFGASALFVIDAVTGEIIAATGEVNVIAFFWSPDSTKLAYVTPASASGGAAMPGSRPISDQADLPQFDWSVLDVAANRARPLSAFTPSSAMVYLLAYFDQFSQSHQLWSPDSRYLVYGQTASVGTSSVVILDTSADAPLPFTLADGEIGVWSYH